MFCFIKKRNIVDAVEGINNLINRKKHTLVLKTNNDFCLATSILKICLFNYNVSNLFFYIISFSCDQQRISALVEILPLNNHLVNSF